jgi:hypothetical protein
MLKTRAMAEPQPLGEAPALDGGGGDELDGWWIKHPHEHPTRGKPDRDRLQYVVECKFCPEALKLKAREYLALHELPPIDWKALGLLPHGTDAVWFR